LGESVGSRIIDRLNKTILLLLFTIGAGLQVGLTTGNTLQGLATGSGALAVIVLLGVDHSLGRRHRDAGDLSPSILKGTILGAIVGIVIGVRLGNLAFFSIGVGAGIVAGIAAGFMRRLISGVGD
jgi:hypothetical protein